MALFLALNLQSKNCFSSRVSHNQAIEAELKRYIEGLCKARRPE